MGALVLYSIEYKKEAPMGALSLYSIEHKIEAHMLGGSLDCVSNGIQNRDHHAGWKPSFYIQLNTESMLPCWMGALILYSIEYRVGAPMLDGSLHSVFNGMQNRGSHAGWEP